MNTARFWKDATERAAKTSAQVVVAFLGADAVNALSVDWVHAAGLALGAAVVSVLTSVASITVGRPDSASLVD